MYVTMLSLFVLIKLFPWRWWCMSICTQSLVSVVLVAWKKDSCCLVIGCWVFADVMIRKFVWGSLSLMAKNQNVSVQTTLACRTCLLLVCCLWKVHPGSLLHVLGNFCIHVIWHVWVVLDRSPVILDDIIIFLQ